LIDGRVSASDNCKYSGTAHLLDLKHAPFLHDHSGHADDIEASERIKIDSLDVLIDEANVTVRDQTGEMRQGSVIMVDLMLPG